MPLRGVVYGGLALIGVAALSAVTQQANHDLPWSGSGLDLDGFGDKVADLVPYALFTLLPILGVRHRVLVGAARRPTAERLETWRPAADHARRSCSPSSALGMILVGMLGGALVPITDLGLQGTVFEEGVFVYVAYGAVLAGLGGVAYWLPKWTGRTIPDKPALGLATARRAGHRAGLAAVLRRRLRRPAGGVRRRTTTTARPSCGTCSSRSATG